jgi:hypothetical protein
MVEFDIENLATLRGLFDQLRIDIESGRESSNYEMHCGKYQMYMNYTEIRQYRVEEINGIKYKIIKSRVNRKK